MFNTESSTTEGRRVGGREGVIVCMLDPGLTGSSLSAVMFLSRKIFHTQAYIRTCDGLASILDKLITPSRLGYIVHVLTLSCNRRCKPRSVSGI